MSPTSSVNRVTRYLLGYGAVLLPVLIDATRLYMNISFKCQLIIQPSPLQGVRIAAYVMPSLTRYIVSFSFSFLHALTTAFPIVLVRASSIYSFFSFHKFKTIIMKYRTDELRVYRNTYMIYSLGE